MPKVAAVILFIAVTDFSAFFGKHAIDLTQMCLHLGNHPFVFLVKQVLHLLPVGISHLHSDFQFCGSILQDAINMLVDGVNLATDFCDRGVLASFRLSDTAGWLTPVEKWH